jgi:hypothetical protein
MQRKSAIAIFFLMASLPLFSQVMESAKGGGMQQWTIGSGFSYFSPDYGSAHLAGGTLWLDETPAMMPQFLRGLSIDFEARDLSLDRSPNYAGLRLDTAGGGLIYRWTRFGKVRPYTKFTEGLGNLDYMTAYGTGKMHRYNSGREVSGMGGGVEIRAYRAVWVRADYEYQYWPDFWISKATPDGAALNPQGLTLGAIYHFGRDRRVY